MEEYADLKEKLVKAIDPVIKDDFMELVDIEINQGKYIRLIIDRPGSGVTLDDCSAISKKVNEIEGLEDIVEGNYSLEVSSPGINRPLKTIAHFKAQTGKNAKLVLKEKIEGENVYTGHIRDASENSVLIQSGGREVVIPFELIKKARLDEEL